MYRCNRCHEVFTEPDYRTTTYGEYYGAEDPYNQKLHIEVCPYCGEEENFSECADPDADEYRDDLILDIRDLDNYDKLDESDFDDIISDYVSGCYSYDEALEEAKKLIQDYLTEEEMMKESDDMKRKQDLKKIIITNTWDEEE